MHLTPPAPRYSIKEWKTIRRQFLISRNDLPPMLLAGNTCLNCDGLTDFGAHAVIMERVGKRSGGCAGVASATFRSLLRLGRSSKIPENHFGFGSGRCGT